MNVFPGFGVRELAVEVCPNVLDTSCIIYWQEASERNTYIGSSSEVVHPAPCVCVYPVINSAW